MRKRQEIADPNSCLNRAADEEPLFVLRGKDLASQIAVAAWIEDRIRSGKNRRDDAQIQSAEEWIRQAIDWQIPF